ncbi:DUF3307 domain-containing protein [Echinicola salinicaeni]|uniref:DUF3307 domain-containing protein n=1 Tax=Echinicola salinicaeni TaxID=2762757 RepID=UPI00164407F4|nr:DUF3307 domain-containing protein [Echinicola salinicaeni]
MSPIQFFILQLIAHVLADFFFQSDRLAIQKNELGFRSPFLKWHILIVFLLSWLLSFQMTFVFGALIIALMHYLIDGLKPWVNKSKSLGKYAFFIDQGLHIIVLSGVCYAYASYASLDAWFNIPGSKSFLLVVFCYMLCLKPANIFIKEVFRAYEIKVPGSDDLPNAGKLIGVLERVLVLTFILFRQFEAVGFLIAAKSILRYKNDDTIKTEYVLIGTMLSFGIAVLLGLLIGFVW